MRKLGELGKVWEHTASTRSKEDLPAFCRPIIETSISVALQGKKSGISSATRQRGRAGEEACWISREPNMKLRH
jgi:hypothetical protein